MTELAHFILFGDFGLLTVTPRYLFLILFPIMTAVGLVRELLTRLVSRDELFIVLTGLGCTTAALATCRSASGALLIWVLVLLVPCSSQIALIGAFGSMVSAQVFAVYALISLVYIFVLLFFILLIFNGSSHRPGHISFFKFYGKSGAEIDNNLTMRGCGRAGGAGAFNAAQLLSLLIMMTFTVPCFNSTVVLFKEEGQG